MTAPIEDAELRNKISDIMTNLMIESNAIRLNNYPDMLENGRRFLNAHNGRLNTVMQLINAHTARKEKAAYINEATHRCNDAIERLWRLDRHACVTWYESQAEFYKLMPTEQTLNETKEEE